MFAAFYFALVWVVQLLVLLALPLLRLKAKYRHSLPARFALWRNAFPRKRIDFWFHACSLGEVSSLLPLLSFLGDSGRDTNVLLTTITKTGYDKALSLQQACGNERLHISVRYLPFEPLLPLWVGDVRKLLVLEAELWYALFAVAKKRGAETVLLNARISTRSYPKYLRFAWFYAQIFAQIDTILAQSDSDKECLQTLGAQNVAVAGNLKILNLPKSKQLFARPARPLVVLASTHNGEESLLFDALRPLYESPTSPFILLVAPRHPERFDSVWELMCTRFVGHKMSRRSAGGAFLESDIVLADSLGELVEFYAIASVVVLCGSFVPVGGHNPLEVAAFSVPLLSGKEIFNQIPLFDLVEGYALIEAHELPEKLANLAALSPTRLRKIPDKEQFFALLK